MRSWYAGSNWLALTGWLALYPSFHYYNHRTFLRGLLHLYFTLTPTWSNTNQPLLFVFFMQDFERCCCCWYAHTWVSPPLPSVCLYISSPTRRRRPPPVIICAFVLL
ncbi:uncharacterized protein BKA78DRAFT_301303 [Phyllosticta capitalensis]|uniref:uncharacterized protein n=1 Tax=Phyllosticta capitalensis TaxID=121624 RepID=UPI00312D1337